MDVYNIYLFNSRSNIENNNYNMYVDNDKNIAIE